MPFFPLPRIYTKEFGKSLLEAWSWHRPHPTLRQKVRVDPQKTDLELFNLLSLGDCWDDAKAVDAYSYLRAGTKEFVPPSWESAFQELDLELVKKGYKI